MNLLNKCSEDCCFLDGGTELTDNFYVCKELNCNTVQLEVTKQHLLVWSYFSDKNTRLGIMKPRYLSCLYH